ncbi:hypothetical protein FI667_g8207, partial [Globisporangium splendens]
MATAIDGKNEVSRSYFKNVFQPIADHRIGVRHFAHEPPTASSITTTDRINTNTQLPTSEQRKKMATKGAAQQISTSEYEREAVEYTTQMVEQLNATVRRDPSIGAKSTFFQDAKNLEQGIPVFQGKHTRFVYDDEEEEIVDAVDVTREAIEAGPYVRTVEDLENEEDDDDEAEHYGEKQGEQEQDAGVTNEFYPEEQDEEDDEDTEMASELDENAVAALLEDVAMELASVALDEKALLDGAKTKH